MRNSMKELKTMTMKKDDTENRDMTTLTTNLTFPETQDSDANDKIDAHLNAKLCASTNLLIETVTKKDNQNWWKSMNVKLEIGQFQHQGLHFRKRPDSHGYNNCLIHSMISVRYQVSSSNMMKEVKTNNMNKFGFEDFKNVNLFSLRRFGRNEILMPRNNCWSNDPPKWSPWLTLGMNRKSSH